jgi:hypothetical protein
MWFVRICLVDAVIDDDAKFLLDSERFDLDVSELKLSVEE